jgi:hypothetical protein
MNATRTVTASALLRRLNRSLARESTRVYKSRPRERYSLGEYHAVYVMTNTVTALHLDLVSWAREAGCLHDCEVVIN